MALDLGLPFVLVRKNGKLPYLTETISFGLEYGRDSLEIHSAAIVNGQSVLIIDDLAATGGTILASSKLVERLGGTTVGAGCPN